MRTCLRGLVILSAAILTGAPAVTFAADIAIDLEWSGPATCPTKDTFLEALSPVLGSDNVAPLRVSVAITKKGSL